MSDSVDESSDLFNALKSELPLDDEVLFNESSKLVTARGTEEGLVLRLDGKAEWNELLPEVKRFIDSRRRFLLGAEVSIEWLDRLPTPEQGEELSRSLQDEFSITIVPRKRKPVPAKAAPKTPERKERRTNMSLLDFVEPLAGSGGSSSGSSLPSAGERRLGPGPGISSQGISGPGTTKAPPRAAYDAPFGSGTIGGGSGKDSSSSERRFGIPDRMSKMLTDEISFDEDANAKVVFGTLRSGQRVETPFSLIIVGDVNPGADLIAGGDIIVLGNLRGTAHASAYDDEGHDRVIIALQMQPMQLRIGSVISRGSDESGDGPEIARIENRRVIVEAFHPRGPQGRKGRA